MGDIYCARCGEPWDASGLKHGDVTPGEAKQILQGAGCPSCEGLTGICTKWAELGYISTEEAKEMCPDMKWGRRCSREGGCEDRAPFKGDAMKALESMLGDCEVTDVTPHLVIIDEFKPLYKE